MLEYRTYEEYLKHPRFRAVVETCRSRAGGRCENEMCVNVAVDPHHVTYCQWGEFDKPENIQMLCRECHEDAHRCQRCGEIKLKAWHIKNDRDTCFECYCHEQD